VLDAITARLRPPAPRRPGRADLRAAVAIVLAERPELEVLLMRRSEDPRDPYAGHVSLPGGRAEEEDEDDVATARRETREEVGLDLAAARVLGVLPEQRAKAHGRLRAMTIVPVVFHIAGPAPTLVLSVEAVRAFWLPLGPVARGELDAIYPWRLGPFTLKMACWRHDGEIVWGLTHRILSILLGR
jgi:8-oxo-dGTP pyrophosphatase MutT (NUDIX family)